jgi:hypothetical protein
LNSDSYINNSNNFYQYPQNFSGNFHNEIPENSSSNYSSNTHINSASGLTKSHKISYEKVDEKTKIQNNDMWKKRYSQNPYFFDRINKEDEIMLQEHLHNLKKKEGIK